VSTIKTERPFIIEKTSADGVIIKNFVAEKRLENEMTGKEHQMYLDQKELDKKRDKEHVKKRILFFCIFSWESDDEAG